MESERKSQVPLLPIKAVELVPHRLPMLFVDRLIMRRGDEAAAIAVMPVEGICVDSAGTFPEFFIEVMAQTAAMANGYDALAANEKANDGMLVGIDSFTYYCSAEPGSEMSIKLLLAFEFGQFKIMNCTIHYEEVLLAEGSIKVWEHSSDE